MSTRPSATFVLVDADGLVDAIAEGAIADLVVILQEVDEVVGGEVVDRTTVRTSRYLEYCPVKTKTSFEALASDSMAPKSS